MIPFRVRPICPGAMGMTARARSRERPIIMTVPPRFRCFERPLIMGMTARARSRERPIIMTVPPRLRCFERPLIVGMTARTRSRERPIAMTVRRDLRRGERYSSRAARIAKVVGIVIADSRTATEIGQVESRGPVAPPPSRADGAEKA